MLLKFLHRDKPAPAPVTLLSGSPAPPHSYPVLSSKALLASRIAAINRIEELVGIPAAYFQQYRSYALTGNVSYGD
jgi:hypothetical protein